MKIFCSNDRKKSLPCDYDIHIDINDTSDIQYSFWKKPIKLVDKFSNLAIDLLYISIFVFSLDKKILRKDQIDGWSRTFDLSISVSDVEFWGNNKNLLEDMLSFLSGDNWTFSFREKEIFDENDFYNRKNYSKLEVREYDTICMLSGGLDSYIGAIDLLEDKSYKILFVSHYGGGKGTKEYQDMVFDNLKNHYNLSELDYIQFNVKSLNGEEDTTRSRSFMFFAHAIVLASALNEDVNLFIPENGFISLNVPLTGARFGSSSTRTTHPYYLKKVKELTEKMGLKLTIINPYQYKTKGEMILSCKNQTLLKDGYVNTMSCSHPDLGRYSNGKIMHCGYCIPCIIRRASLFKSYGEDKTEVRDSKLTLYKVAELNKNAFIQHIAKFKESSAIFQIQKSGALYENLIELADVYCRGIYEIKNFLENLSNV